MRAYRVEGGGKLRFAGTAADAKDARQDLAELTGERKKDISVSEVEIPTAKDSLLGFINDLVNECAASDD
jgi:hypothetical protein